MAPSLDARCEPDAGAGPGLPPDVYDQALRLPPSWPQWTEIAFPLALGAFIALLAIGVLLRRRWLFWLILVAFLAGVLRVPVAVMHLTGVLHATTPTWYVTFQGLIGLAQLTIGLAMLTGYRRAGPGSLTLSTWCPILDTAPA